MLLDLGADLLLKGVTAGSVSLENIEKLEKQYLERRFAVESEMRNLRQTLKAEVDKVQAAGASDQIRTARRCRRACDFCRD